MRKRIISVLVALAMLVAMLPATAFSESISVFVSIVQGGEFVSGGENIIANIEVPVTDVNESGSCDIDDLLYITHETYYDGGASVGYGSETTSNGLSLTRLWGDASGCFGYYRNNAAAMSLAETVSDGDCVYAFIYQDTQYWSDIHTYFTSHNITAKKNEEVILSLKHTEYDLNYNPISVATPNATIAINGEDTLYATDAEGNVTITFSEIGEYKVSARTDDGYITPPVCTINVTEEGSDGQEEEPDRDDDNDSTQASSFDERAAALMENIAKGYVSSTDFWTAMDMGAYEDFAENTPNCLTDKAKRGIINSAINTVLKKDSDVEIDKAILALTAIGKDATRLYKVNDNASFSAIEKLNNVEKSTSAWSAPYTLAAYNQGAYATDNYESALVTALLDSQSEDGSWDEYGTIDTTANAIAGLSFYQDDNNVKTAVENAINYLSLEQNDDGTYSSFGSANSNSTAMVIIALSAAGVDFKTDERFTKNGNNILDALISFALEDNSGFGYSDNSELSAGSTEQAFRALVSASVAISTGNAYNIYDFSGKALTSARAEKDVAEETSPELSGEEISVKVSIKTESEYWLKNYVVTLPKNGAKVEHAFVKACSDNRIEQEGAENGYVASIIKDGKSLGEFDKGASSGWLYKVNGIVPDKSISEYGICTGDNIVFYYTKDYSLDKSYYTRPQNSLSSITASKNDVSSHQKIAETLIAQITSPTVSQVGGEWLILALARGDGAWANEYFEKYYSNVCKYIAEKGGVLHQTKYTEYARVSLALTALGKNPRNVAGYDIITPLSDFEKVTVQGTTGAAFALLAIDCGNYGFDEEREKYIDYILENQNDDGGFALTKGAESDIDVTAMALQAFAPYKEREDVAPKIEKALAFISRKQTERGGFVSRGVENAESSAQVLMALSALRITETDSRFVKKGNSVYKNLMTFFKEGEGFCHTHGDSEINLMTTEQAICALNARDRSDSNKKSFYDMQDHILLTDTLKSFGLEGKHQEIGEMPIILADKTFADIGGNKYRKEIEELAKRGIINGKADEAYEPESTMTRAEFSTICVRALGLSVSNDKIFEDVSEKDWHFPYVSTAYRLGIIKGISDTLFNPEGTITKEEAQVMIARCAKLCGHNTELSEDETRNSLSQFTDYTSISDWAKISSALCVDLGIVTDEDLEFMPTRVVKRDEIAHMVYTLLKISKLIEV